MTRRYVVKAISFKTDDLRNALCLISQAFGLVFRGVSERSSSIYMACPTARLVERIFFPIAEFRGWRLSRRMRRAWDRKSRVRAEMEEINRKRMEWGLPPAGSWNFINGRPIPWDGN